MKKLIPFKKEVKFENNLYEVTSISLEHTLHKEDKNITGDFIVSGEYRITETSTNTLPFSYTLPFMIDIADKYNIDNASIDINDFYYEIIDNKFLDINIEVKIDHIEEVSEVYEEVIEDEGSDERNNIEEDDIMYNEDIKLSCIDDEDENIERVEVDDSINSLFANMTSVDTYVNYKVYIVREGDSLDNIMANYKVSKEDLSQYNDISDIKIGDKIIIPYVKD